MISKNDWNKLYAGGASYMPISEITLDELDLSGTKALDIGCGSGMLLSQLSSRGFEVHGVDLSDVAIDKARQTLPSANLQAVDFMDYQTNEIYDVVFINKVLAFADDKSKFVKKAMNLVKPGGKLAIITPVILEKYEPKYSDRLRSISVYEKDLANILPANYQVISKRYIDSTYGCEFTIQIVNK